MEMGCFTYAGRGRVKRGGDTADSIYFGLHGSRAGFLGECWDRRLMVEYRVPMNGVCGF